MCCCRENCGQLVAHKAWTPTEDDVNALARVCHEANRAWCSSQGDGSQPDWDNAPDWQKNSIMEGVRHHLTHDADADMSHELWMRSKLEEGWRYGPVKDADSKVHPCLLPRRFLSPADRVKDDIFVAIVRGYRNAMQELQNRR